MKSLTVLVLGSLMTLTLTGCPSGGGYSSGWYSYSGTYCGDFPYPGCNFDESGYKIRYWEDPYWFQVDFVMGDGYCYYSGYCQWYWVSPTGIMYDPFGYAVNSSEASGRDVIRDVADAENEAMENTASHFAAKYGLADDQALRIVSELHAFEKASRGRSRTTADLDALSKRLTGKGYAEIAGALKDIQNGELEATAGLEKDVATFWGTDPETVRQVLKAWMSQPTVK